ncbi:unnamed protein product [Rotaria sp. Silwood2]|nr:unnamed protein product [Rotaria sp. Silwood2]CAF2636751.1 unnamed protein product [Rotaria sp. Silwood2]CAF2886001.1 unnamed protein product [Rotaria sp. Silwood2]CAF3044478.1 unnamed protein product [Rotaria sp. Silwood2]CAF3943152.1 unnamed protein product [Rotaria sp. Silwood2]
MADNFDLLKNTANRDSTTLNTQAGKNKSNTNDNLNHPTYKSVWTRQSLSDVSRPMSSPDTQQSQIYIIEQRTKPYWETGEDSVEDWHQDQTERHQGKYLQKKLASTVPLELKLKFTCVVLLSHYTNMR